VILVDTSVWVEHLRRGLPRLARLLQEGEALIHPWVIGELACGNLRNRQQLLELLQGLPAATVASDAEVLQLIEGDQLMGRGIGYVGHRSGLETLGWESGKQTRDWGRTKDWMASR